MPLAATRFYEWRQRGSRSVPDGEQRASSFATYLLTDTLAGTGLAENLARDGQYFAVFTDGPSPATAKVDWRAVPLQDLCGGVCERSDENGDEAIEAGGDCAVEEGDGELTPVGNCG